MLDQLMQLIQQSSQESVINNPEVPNDANDAIMNEAQQTLANGLRGLADTGDLQALAAVAAKGEDIQQQPAVQRLSGDLSGNLMQKLGLNSGVAKMIAAAVIPMVLGKILKGSGTSSAGAQSGGGFDIGDLLSSLTGGGQQQGQAPQGSGGLMDKLSDIGSKLGLDKDGDGDVDLNDLSKLIK